MTVKPPLLPTHFDDFDIGLFKRTGEIAGVNLEGHNFEPLDANGCLIERSRIVKSNLELVQFSNAHFRDVFFERCGLANAQWPSSRLDRVEFRSCRSTGFVGTESQLTDIAFFDCRLDLSVMRFAIFSRVSFIDCDLTSADFYSLQASDVEFIRCRLAGASFAKAHLADVDFRSSEIGDLQSSEGLQGAIIDSGQLMELAPKLAVQAGLRVEG